MIISKGSIDSEKAFDKIQYLLMIETSQNGHRRNLPQHSKGHIWWAYSKHYSQCWKPESIPPKIRNNQRMSIFATIIQHNSGSPSYSNQRINRNKRNPDGTKKEIKLSLFADDMILYIENPKDSIRKLLALTSEFSKVTGYKSNTQKSFVFPYTNNEK